MAGRPGNTPHRKKLAVDCVFFQDYQTGIARLWTAVLAQWEAKPPPFDVVLLDRDGTAPPLGSFPRVTVGRHQYDDLPGDRRMLQDILDDIDADLFTSTYYSHPLSTPSALLVYDMIPETLGGDLTEPMWREKHDAIRYASAFCCISQNTAKDLRRIAPFVKDRPLVVNPPGVSAHFHPAGDDEKERFRSAHELTGRAFFLFVGRLGSYKNGARVAAALSRLNDAAEISLFVTGGHHTDPDALRRLAPNLHVTEARLDDGALRAAYSSAEALVFPSVYEGFGLPVIEAMACGCPVVTSNAGSLPEAAGNAAIQVDPMDVDAILAAVKKVRRRSVRRQLIRLGLTQAGKFPWDSSAANLAAFFADAM